MIHAVIGVKYQGPRTFYVKRSDRMDNYPGVWSLISVQYTPAELVDPLNVNNVQRVFAKLSKERMYDAPLEVWRYLTSGSCSDNPMSERVHLHLYQVDFPDDVRLNPRYYTDSAWLTPAEYTERAAGATCGLCMRLWSDYAVRHGLVDKRFAPEVPKT